MSAPVFFQVIVWAPVGSAFARCIFTTVLAWAPRGLLVGSCVFLRFHLDSMVALQWALLGQVRFYISFGMGVSGLLIGPSWAPVFF